MATATIAPQETEACPRCLAGNLNWLLAQAHYTLAGELAAALEPLSISPRGHSVLAVAMTGSYTQTQLADLVGLDKTTMVVTLDELEAADLARRVISSTDRRARVVEVTAKGRRKVTQADEIMRRVQADVLSALGTGGDSALVEALGQLVQRRLAEPAAGKTVRRREPRAQGA